MKFVKYIRRSSLRLAGYDYRRGGAYFVTIVAKHKQPFFIDPILRIILKREWKNLESRFSAIKLDAFVIMPDHIHFVLWIDDRFEDRPSLSAVIQAYKSIVSNKWINHFRDTSTGCDGKIWQRSFYDCIIKSRRHLIAVRRYIINNPAKALEHQKKKYTQRIEQKSNQTPSS
jgi:REP element-mobilizing transposase RayT